VLITAATNGALEHEFLLGHGFDPVRAPIPRLAIACIECLDRRCKRSLYPGKIGSYCSDSRPQMFLRGRLAPRTVLYRNAERSHTRLCVDGGECQGWGVTGAISLAIRQLACARVGSIRVPFLSSL